MHNLLILLYYLTSKPLVSCIQKQIAKKKFIFKHFIERLKENEAIKEI